MSAVTFVAPGRDRAAFLAAPSRAALLAAPSRAAFLAAPSPSVDERTDTDEVVGHDLPWDVIVWDDPVNLMAYVVHVFRKVLGVDEHVAHRLMMEVHTEGRSLVATEPRQTAEKYVQQLHAHGLQATMRRST